MKYSPRRFFALLLALIMVLSLAPLDAVAEIFTTYEANVVIDTSEAVQIVEAVVASKVTTEDGYTVVVSSPDEILPADGEVLYEETKVEEEKKEAEQPSAMRSMKVAKSRASAEENVPEDTDKSEDADNTTRRTVGLYDITVVDANGKEWQPQEGEKVDVRVRLTNPVDIQAGARLTLVHDPENKAEIVPATFYKNTEGQLSGFAFVADGFSVYAVEEEIENNTRINVKFMDGENERATLIVKKSDTFDGADPDYSRVLYDPGTNALQASEVFRGWYAEDAPNTLLTIADIRAQVKTMFEGDVTDGTTITYYAAVNKIIMVTYLNEKETSLGSYSEEVPRDTGNTVSSINYKVDMVYTPADTTHDFDGWYVKNGLENIIEPTGLTENSVLENGTTIKITGDVTFSVSSPEGHWLVFNENGKGATYNAPQFVKHNEVTHVPPLAMQRKGYQFRGWYTDADCTDGNEFEFGNPLSESIEIYAKWEANETAGYTIIFWTQRTGGDTNKEHYDVKESVYIENGTVGDNITYTYEENGDEHYIIDNAGNTHHYTGFYMKAPEEPVQITPEGDAILNIYYDRIKYNFRFYLYRVDSNGQYSYANGSAAGQNVWGLASWHTRYPENGNYITTLPTTTYEGGLASDTVQGYTAYYFVLSAYYGENITSKWPRYDQILAPANTVDREPVSFIMMVGTALKDRAYGDGRDTIKGQVKYMDENILGDTSDANGNYVIVRFKNYNNWTYNIYVEGEPLHGEPTKTCQKNGKTYYLLESVSSRSTNTDPAQQNAPPYAGYVAVKRDSDPTKAYYESHGQGSCELDYFYDRLSYRINYLDGVYLDGDGNVITGLSEQTFTPSDPIFYEELIPDRYKNYIPEDAPAGYVFDTWCVDEACQHPYVFAEDARMPLDGIKLYARWRLIQYRVFLKPNVPEEDTSLTWGSATQAMTFRVAYNGVVSLPTGLRDDYELVGWYSSNGAYNEKTKVTEANTEAYDKTVDKTDPMNKYGLGATTNTDTDRFWVTKKLELNAVWRAKIPGALGIKIEYDPSDHQDPENVGTKPPTDNRLYVDSAKAPAQGACKPPEGKVFSNWVLQTWNGTAYVDTDTKVFPGESFTVKKSDSKILVTQWVNPNNENDIVTVSDPEPGTTAPDTTHTTIKEASYTVRLRAEYKDPIESPKTTIIWYSNYGDANNGKGTIYRTDSDIPVNKNVRILGVQSRTGYTFKGWTQTQGGDTASLVYTGSGFTSNGKAVSNIAPDGSQTVEELFAVWAEDEVTINYVVATDSTGMGTVDPASETVKVITGTAEGSEASVSNDLYVFDYWTCDDGSEHVGEDAVFVPGRNNDGLYEAHTYYAHFKKYKAPVTVHHYLKGTTTQVADDVTTNEVIGSEFTATPVTTYQQKNLTVDSYDPAQPVTVSADGNVITIYYTLPLTIEAKTASKTYDGNPLNGAYTVTGALDSDATAINNALGTAPSITHVADSPKEYLTADEQTTIAPSIPSYYTVTYTSGTLTINPVDLTIAMADRTLPYTGEEQYGWSRTDEDKETVTGLLNNETITIDYTPSKGTTVGTYNNGAYDTATLSIKDGTTDVTKDYNLTSATAGKLTIEKDNKKLAVESASKDWDYDATSHTYQVYTVTYGDEELKGTEGQTTFKLSTGDTVTVTPTEKGTNGVKNVSDSGANSFTWTVENEDSYTKGTDKVGTLTINPVDVTIAMADRTLPYNGQTQYGWSRTDDGKETVTGLVNNETVTIDYTASSGKTVGTYDNGAYDTATLIIKDGETDVTKDYNLTSVTPGKLTIEKDNKKLAVESASKDWDYDAATHTYQVYTVTYGDETINGTEGQTTFKLSTGDTVTVTPTEKGANGVKNVSDSGDNSFTWTVENDDCYTKGKDKVGTLTINPVDLTIAMADRTLPYNGQTQYGWTRTDDGKETVTGLVNSETVTIDYTASSGKTVGTYENGAYDTATLSIKDGTTDVTENYNLTSTTPGKLTIEKDNNKQLAVESASKDWDYDAAAHTYKVYTVTYGDEKLEGTEGQTTFKLSTGDIVTVTPTEKGANGVKNVSDSGDNSFTWTVENDDCYTKGKDEVGTLTINPVDLTIAMEDRTLVYNAKTQYGWSRTDDGKETVTGLVNNETVTIDYTPSSGKLVAEYTNGKYDTATLSIKDGTTDVTENYNLTSATPGKLTITDEGVDAGLVVTKKVADDKEYALGETVTFNITATNIYAEPKTIKLIEIEGVTLAKDTFENVAPGAVIETTATYTITEADILNGEFTNKVTAKIVDLEKEATATAKTEKPNAKIDVKKETTSTPANGKAYVLGETITYRITVKNIGNVTITDTLVTDENTGDEWTIETLKPGESKAFETDYTVTEADVLAGSVKNVATAKGHSPNDDIPDPSDEDDVEDPTEDPNPHLTIDKTTTSKSKDPKGYAEGEEITYKITVKNDGNLTITDITVKDKLTGDDWTIESMAPGDVKTYEASYIVKAKDVKRGTVVNVATVEGTSPDPDNPDVKDRDEEPNPTVGYYKLTIEYVYQDGTEAAETYTEEELSAGDNYNVKSPTIPGYHPSIKIVQGTMPKRDVTITVIYVPNQDIITIEDFETPLGFGLGGINAGETIE